MKFFIIPYIALGLLLSLAIGIHYNCSSSEMFPEFYGSPFVFKRKWLGSSMTYCYSISGLVFNWIIWTVAVLLLHKGVMSVMKKDQIKKWLNPFYKTLVGIALLFTTLVVHMHYLMLGQGFEENSNYWYWNMEREAAAYGNNCEGEVIFLQRVY
jgi:hypothetical protein